MRIVAPLLILLSFTASMEHVLVRGLFALRQDHVATHLCENRDKPHLRCNGKCFLKKRMEDTHRHDEESRQTGPEVVVAFNLLVPATAELPATPNRSDRSFAVLPRVELAAGVFPDVTHPPEHTA